MHKNKLETKIFLKTLVKHWKIAAAAAAAAKGDDYNPTEIGFGLYLTVSP
jgi:hypothetical protein